MLGSRQLAVIVWGVIFAVWAMSRKDVRSSLISALQALMAWKVALSLGLVTAWNFGMVWVLYRLGFWNATMLYDTVLFVLVGGIGSVMKAAPQEVTYDLRFFVRTTLTNLGFMVLLAFLSDFFAFNFWVEFLLVVPFMTLLVMLVVVSGMGKGNEDVHRLLSKTQSFIGIALIAYIAWRGVTEFHQLANLQVLCAFLLPFAMSVLFLPLLFAIGVVFAYGNAYFLLSWGDEGMMRLLSYKKRRLFLRFGLNLKGLQVFRRSRAFHDFRWAESKEEAKDVLRSWSGSTPEPEPDDVETE